MFAVRRFSVGKSHPAPSTPAASKETSFLRKLNKTAKKRLEKRSRDGDKKKKEKPAKKKKKKKKKCSKKKEKKPQKAKKKDTKKRKKNKAVATTGSGTDSDIEVEGARGERSDTPQKRGRAQVNTGAEDAVEETKIGASLLTARSLLQGWKTRNYMKKTADAAHKNSSSVSLERSSGTTPASTQT